MKTNNSVPVLVDNSAQTVPQKDTVDNQIEETLVIRRSARVTKKPARYADSDHMDPLTLPNFSVSSDTDGTHKIKRVLGQKSTSKGTEYLVHIVGEPSDNAIWVPFSSFNYKARKAIKAKPPPVLK